MPRIIRTLGSALYQLPDLTQDLVEEERRRQASEPGVTNINMLSMLVRIADANKSRGKGQDKNYLTYDEVSGNLFQFTGAGFDTTANIMTYALVFMAADRNLQAWVQEELDQVFGKVNKKNAVGMDKQAYACDFPKLIRCQALMVSLFLREKIVRRDDC